MRIIQSAAKPRLASPYPSDRDTYLFDWNDPAFINQDDERGKVKELKAGQVLQFIKANKLVAMDEDDMLDSPSKIQFMIETLDNAQALMSVNGKYALALSVEWEDGQTLLVPSKWKKVNFEDYVYE